MKRIIILLLSCLILVPAFAQKTKKDQVFLKSGAVIKGQLITHDAEIVKINSAGNEWVFKNEDVDSISKFKRAVKREVRTTQGYFFDTSMGVLVGNSGNSQKYPFSFMTAVNFRLIRNVYLGAGLGAEFLQETYMPAFGQLQWRFRDTRTTPFLNLQLGYQVPLEDVRGSSMVYYDYYPYPQTSSKIHADGGYLINPSFGFQHFSSENLGWFFSFGYRYHQLNYSGDNNYKLETNFSRLSLKIGFIFN
ncbi:MAG TPA: hypothetical protein DCL77_06190 [Prolixibacteraceae bacterium]|jgi:hypothetical protein|nr:hypothetical protein [Prolixibacteraceae bacterium]